MRDIGARGDGDRKNELEREGEEEKEERKLRH